MRTTQEFTDGSEVTVSDAGNPTEVGFVRIRTIDHYGSESLLNLRPDEADLLADLIHQGAITARAVETEEDE